MAAQPKKKISRVRGRTRRAHDAIKLPRLMLCPNCKHPKPSHIACPECGFYGNKKILTTGADKRIAKQLKQTKKETSSKSEKITKVATSKKTDKNSGAETPIKKSELTSGQEGRKNTRTTKEVRESRTKNK